MGARTFVARVGDETFTVRVDGHRVAVRRESSEAPLELDTHYLGHGRVVVGADGAGQVAWVVEDGDLRWVFADGDLTTVEVTEGPARARRRGTADAPPTLHAPMPATVVRIVAPPGTRVHRGATVVLLEAMKMELPLRAPHDAVVTAVHCREGELVQPNAVLVDLERLPDAAATEADAAAGTAVRGPGRAVPSGSRQP